MVLQQIRVILVPLQDIVLVHVDDHRPGIVMDSMDELHLLSVSTSTLSVSIVLSLEQLWFIMVPLLPILPQVLFHLQLVELLLLAIVRMVYSVEIPRMPIQHVFRITRLYSMEIQQLLDQCLIR